MIAHLNKLWQDVKDLLPAVEPEGVAVPVPVLSELREIGIEPGRDGHHEGLSRNSADPSPIRVDGLVGRAAPMWPSVPWDCSSSLALVWISTKLSDFFFGSLTGSVNRVQVRLERLGSHGRPRRNEEQCASALLNLGPLGNEVGSLEGRDERLIVNLELRRAVLVGVDKVRNLGDRPGATAKLME